MTRLFTIFTFVLFLSGCQKMGRNVQVGMTVQDLSNPTWLGYCQAIQKEAEAHGADMHYVGCGSDPSKQVAQIQQFITDKVDVIIVHPTDPVGIEPVCKEARDAGIKVISWDDDIANADMRWLIDNYALGYKVGTQAAEFVKEKLGGKAKVAILNYPQLPVLLERGNGIREAINNLAPEAHIIAESSAINPKEGIFEIEKIFAEHPGTKVVCCIGGGGSVGANEAALATDKISEDFGIFAVDATRRELEAIKNNEGVRMSMIVTGTNQDVATQIFSYVEKLARGDEVAERVYREVIPVTAVNVDQYYQVIP